MSLKYVLFQEGSDLEALRFRLGWRVGGVVHRLLASGMLAGVLCAREVALLVSITMVGRADLSGSLVCGSSSLALLVTL